MSRWDIGPILTSGREGARRQLAKMGPDVLLLSSTSNYSLRGKLHTLALVRDFGGSSFWVPWLMLGM